MTARETLQQFDPNNLPDLDVAVLGTLELLSDTDLPESNTPFRRPLVIGSGNAEATGRILFRNNDAVFADESSYQLALEKTPNIDGIVLISASGGKHALMIAKDLENIDLPKLLFTNNPNAPAAEYFDSSDVRVLPKNREPYTYNTSTYLSMIMADTSEDAAAIKDFIENEVAAALPEDLSAIAYTLIVPPEFSELRPMLRTKFEELFGPKFVGRVFTSEEIKHAKTVVSDEKELFISFGVANNDYGSEGNRIEVPLPAGGGYAAALAVSYFVIGKIQAAQPPYFKDSINRYCEEASRIFNQTITPIVE